jgi:hypothetical protein
LTSSFLMNAKISAEFLNIFLPVSADRNIAYRFVEAAWAKVTS